MTALCMTGYRSAGIMRPRFRWIQDSALPAGTAGGGSSGGAGLRGDIGSIILKVCELKTGLTEITGFTEITSLRNVA